MVEQIQAAAITAAMYVDLKRCIGCNACSLACKQEHNVAIGERWTEVYGAENGSLPAVNWQVLPMMCQQCNEAPCVKKCDDLKYFAIKRRPDGIVYVDPKLCVGCRECVPVCPYQAMNFNTQKLNKLGQPGVAEKCNFCMERLDNGLQPACVITCLGITLEFGDLNALRAKHPSAEEMGDADKLKVLYDNLGDQPKRRTGSYPDPTPFHD